MTLNQMSMTKLKSQYKHENFEHLSLKKRINNFKLAVNEHVIITHFHDFSKTFMI